MTTLVPEYPMGFDHGNAETSGFILDTKARVYSYKMASMLALGKLEELANKRGSRGDTYQREVDALRSDELVTEFGDSEYFVGELALRESRSASSSRGDISRYSSTRALILLLAISGKMVPDPEYALHLVTGLPVETFNNENREKVREALEGEHSFVLNGKRRKAYVTVARVVMEGVGGLITYGESESVLQGVIDIGGRTTDLYVARGQKAFTERCKGLPRGVETVGDILSDHFHTYHGRPLRGEEIRDVLQAYSQRKDLPPLMASGKRVDSTKIRQWIEIAINDVSQDILSFVSSTWNTAENGNVAGDIHPVLIVGGGAYYFASAIQGRIEHASVPHKPEFANAEGYANLARTSQQLKMPRSHEIA